MMYHEKIVSILKAQNIVLAGNQFDEPLSNYGLDSLQLALLVLSIEKAFDIKMPLEGLLGNQVVTVNRINRLIQEGYQSCM